MTESKARSASRKDEIEAASRAGGGKSGGMQRPGVMQEARSRAAKVTEENRAEAARLKALYDKKTDGRSQAEFGAEFGIGSQSVVWQYLNAKMPLNLRAAAAFAKGLKRELTEFSPRLAREAAAIAQHGKSEAKPSLLTLLELNKEEQQLVALFRDLNGDQRSDVLQLANRLHNEMHPHASPANPFPAAPAPAKKAPAKRTTRA